MKRLLCTISLFALAATQASATTATASHSTAAKVQRQKTQAKVDYNAHPELLHAGGTVAPADEYFGRMKMSILGIRNEIKDMTIKVGFQPDKAASFLGMADLTEDAIHDWEKKYPHDSWIPKTLLELERLYEASPVPEFQPKLKSTVVWLWDNYKHTRYAQTGHEEYLARLAALANPTPAAAAEAPTTPAPIDISNPSASQPDPVSK